MFGANIAQKRITCINIYIEKCLIVYQISKEQASHMKSDVVKGKRVKKGKSKYMMKFRKERQMFLKERNAYKIHLEKIREQRQRKEKRLNEARRRLFLLENKQRDDLY